MSETQAERYRRLRWQCRRGILELDRILSAFLETGYPLLDPPGQERFEHILSQPDHLLSQWLFGGRARPADQETDRVVQAIRRTPAS
ncbi:MAG: succinate dehydrogenase assembly factor 2 [Chromatiales bacterium]|nr:succinate dehydrogenase assembly factor 2 [Chromatiales bacterium]